MEHFLLYSIGLSLVSFLCMVLTKPPYGLPPHANSDDDLLFNNSGIPLHSHATSRSSTLPGAAGQRAETQPYFDPEDLAYTQLVSDFKEIQQ